MFRGISLANKCLLLFGAAVVLIIMSALTVPWLRLNALVEDDGVEASRQMIRVWESMRRQAPAPAREDEAESKRPEGVAVEGGRIILVPGDQVGAERQRDPFVGEAWDRFLEKADRQEHASASWRLLIRHYRYARAVRDDRNKLVSMIVLERQSPQAARDMVANTIYLLSAGSVALGLAVLVFYLITNKLVLSPVRALRETTEQVRGGNLNIRSEIQTGDEFEELAETFNEMLAALQDTQRSLRSINTELDKRVDALEAQNVALNDANRLKGEFLANVSHELRTPLNSILGFAELLTEVAQKEAEAGDDSTRLAKRRRYLDNILSAGRSLLDLINGLLEMAKIEAGKIDITLEKVDLRETAEGLVALVRPLADKRGVELRLEIAGDGPVVIESDGRKLQQIVFNLMSNAVKFTGDTAEKIAAERQDALAELDPADPDAPPAPPSPAPPRSRAARPSSPFASSLSCPGPPAAKPPKTKSASASSTPAPASPPSTSGSSSTSSPRSTAASPASTPAPAWACPSARSSPPCSRARFTFRASWGAARCSASSSPPASTWRGSRNPSSKPSSGAFWRAGGRADAKPPPPRPLYDPLECTPSSIPADT